MKTNCRQIGQQEFYIVSSIKKITKYSEIILDPYKIKQSLDTAWDLATSGRTGPVWIDIPLDIQASDVNIENLLESPNTIHIKNLDEINKFDKYINKRIYKKPIVVIGNGIKSSGTKE